MLDEKQVKEKYPDLSHNYSLFHERTTAKQLQVTYEKKPLVQSHYDSIEDIEQDIIDNPTKYIDMGSITVRCKTSHFFTCDGTLVSGDGIPKYDRLGSSYKEIETKGERFLRQCDGYSPHSEYLHGMVRWVYDKKGNVINLVIVKDRGNCRTWMALKSTNGVDVELIIVLHFHENNPSMDVSDMIAIEAANFNQDAVDRRGLGQKETFVSGYLADKVAKVKQAEWLEKINVDFGNLIATLRHDTDVEKPEFTLSSIAKLSFGIDGKPSCDLAKWGPPNVEVAISLCKEILTRFPKRSREISIEWVMMFARTFYFFCSETKDATGKVRKPLASQDEVKKFLLFYMTRPTDDDETYGWNMDQLSRVGKSDRDLTFKAFKVFVPALVKKLKKINDRKNRYSSDTPAIKSYIETIEIPELQYVAINQLKMAA